MTITLWFLWAFFGLLTGVATSALWYRVSRILSCVAVIPFMWWSSQIFQGDWALGILSLLWLVPTYGMKRNEPPTTL